MALDLELVMRDAHVNQLAKGFEVPSFPEFIALCHSELSEALEHHRVGHLPNTEFFVTDGDKSDGIPIELADVIIRIAGYAQAKHIDLCGAIVRKMNYNLSRPFKHGGKVL